MHYGKVYPLGPGYDFWMFNEGYVGWQYGIPRCWKQENTGATSGVLAAKWAGLTVVSEPWETTGDRDRLWWIFRHPDDDEAYVRWEVTWEEYAATETFPATNFRYRYITQYWDGGVKWSDGLMLLNPQPNQWNNVTGSTQFNLVGINWPGIVNAAQFAHMGSNTKWRSASWADQEADYHPYRYRPA